MTIEAHVYTKEERAVKALVELGAHPEVWHYAAIGDDFESIDFRQIDGCESVPNTGYVVAVMGKFYIDRAHLLSLPCEECGGGGKHPWETSRIEHVVGFSIEKDPCPTCHGSGKFCNPKEKS